MKTLFLLLLAVTLATSVHAQTTWQEWQREAIRRYPELGIPDSPLSKLFLADCNRRRTAEPNFFSSADWPVRLATSCFVALRQPATALPTITRDERFDSLRASPKPRAVIPVAKPKPAPREPNDADAFTRWAESQNQQYLREQAAAAEERAQRRSLDRDRAEIQLELDQIRAENQRAIEEQRYQARMEAQNAETQRQVDEAARARARQFRR